MKARFFAQNRLSLIEQLHGGCAVFSAYLSTQKSGDMANDFLQEANFWYLTGIEKPGWWVIIDGARLKSWLVMPEQSEVHAIFDGSLPLEKAQKISGVDGVLSRHEADLMLRDMAKNHAVVYTLDEPKDAAYYDFVCNPAPRRLRQKLTRVFREVKDCQHEITALRAIKQLEEIGAIKKAVSLTNETFSAIKSQMSTYAYEYEIDAAFTYQFRMHNATHAYAPIVASGSNACTLHYIDNAAPLKKDGFVLCDIGARVDGYAADVTRTYSGGSPTKRSIEIHEAVVEAQAEIVALLGPGVSVNEYLQQVDKIMKRQLVSLGLIGSNDDDEGYRTYMPHAISHGLGIDVHDSLGKPREFEPGMVLTVEPGIYVPQLGVGVRIEDDIVITSSGHENLSQNLDHAW